MVCRNPAGAAGLATITATGPGGRAATILLQVLPNQNGGGGGGLPRTGTKGPVNDWALGGLAALVAGILILVVVRSSQRRRRSAN